MKSVLTAVVAAAITLSASAAFAKGNHSGQGTIHPSKEVTQSLIDAVQCDGCIVNGGTIGAKGKH